MKGPSCRKRTVQGIWQVDVSGSGVVSMNQCDCDERIEIVQFTVSSGLHSVLERPFSEANGHPFFVKNHYLACVDLDSVVLCSSLHDGISRYLIVENHCFPVIWITL